MALTIDLRGPDGNAFAVMAYATRIMRAAGRSEDEIDAMTKEAMSGNYDNLLDVCAREAGLTYVGRREATGSQHRT